MLEIDKLPFLAPVLDTLPRTIKVRGFAAEPRFVVRMPFLGQEFDTDYYARGQAEHKKLASYGVNVPEIRLVRTTAGIMTIVDRIHGQQLMDATDISDAKLNAFYRGLAGYFRDKNRDRTTFLADLRFDQFMYGHRIGEGEENVYLVDVDPFIAHCTYPVPSRALISPVRTFGVMLKVGLEHFPAADLSDSIKAYEDLVNSLEGLSPHDRDFLDVGILSGRSRRQLLASGRGN